MSNPPPFDPNQPFQVEGTTATGSGAVPPAFDPSQPFDTEQATQAPTEAPGGIVGNVLGGIGDQTAQVANSFADGVASNFAGSIGQLGPGTREARYQKNVAEHGPFLGTLKDMLIDTPGEVGNAIALPLKAMGAVSVPIMGLMHGTVGRILAQIPGMDQQQANDLIDKASMFIAPASMRYGLNPPPGATAADNIANAPANAQADTAQANAQARAANPMLAQARDAGYVVTPSESGVDSTVGNVASQFGGKIKTQQAASVRNQEVTNGLAARDLGLPADATLDEATFNGVRAREGGAYRVIKASASSLPTGRIVADQDYLDAITGLGTPSAEFAADFPEAAAERSASIDKVQKQVLKQDFSPTAGVEMIRNLRDDARVNLKNWADADKIRLGMAQRNAASAMEDLIERNLTAAGNPDAVANYQAARQTIAKSHDIEAATNAAGDVDARKIAVLGQNRTLTGGLKVIADTASAFPKSMQGAKFGGLEKRSILDTLWSAGTAATGIASGHPVTGFAAAAVPLVRPLARDVALSNGVQNGLLGLRQQPGNFGPMFKAGALPAIAGANDLNMLQQEIARLFSRPQQQPQQ